MPGPARWGGGDGHRSSQLCSAGSAHCTELDAEAQCGASASHPFRASSGCERCGAVLRGWVCAQPTLSPRWAFSHQLQSSSCVPLNDAYRQQSWRALGTCRSGRLPRDGFPVSAEPGPLGEEERPGVCIGAQGLPQCRSQARGRSRAGFPRAVGLWGCAVRGWGSASRRDRRPSLPTSSTFGTGERSGPVGPAGPAATPSPFSRGECCRARLAPSPGTGQLFEEVCAAPCGVCTC